MSLFSAVRRVSAASPLLRRLSLRSFAAAPSDVRSSIADLNEEPYVIHSHGGSDYSDGAFGEFVVQRGDDEEDGEIGRQNKLKTYIVFVDPPAGRDLSQQDDLDNWYKSFLPKTASEPNEPSRLVHTYSLDMAAFAARLSPNELKEIEKKDGFLHAMPDVLMPLNTTDSS